MFSFVLGLGVFVYPYIIHMVAGNSHSMMTRNLMSHIYPQKIAEMASVTKMRPEIRTAILGKSKLSFLVLRYMTCMITLEPLCTGGNRVKQQYV